VSLSRVGRGSRRRTSIVLAVAVFIGVAGIALVNSGAGATTGSTQVFAPNEPANQVTVNINADGSIALPMRDVRACQSLICPSGLSYTAIAPGRTNFVINDPSGAKVEFKFGRVFDRHFDSRHTHKTPRAALREGQQTIDTVINRVKTARLVLLINADPYSVMPTTSSSPTTGPEPHSKVVVTLDPGGENGVLAVSPSEVPAGYVDVEFDVPNTVGNPALYLEVHPKLGTQLVTTANQTHTMLLCEHDWILRVLFQDNQYTTTTIATNYTGPFTFLQASGSSPLCTTPIT